MGACPHRLRQLQLLCVVTSPLNACLTELVPSFPAGATSGYGKQNGKAACQGKTGALGALSDATKVGLRKMFEVQTQIYEYAARALSLTCR